MTSTPIDLDSLAPLFHPRSVAVIGASSDPAKIGGLPVHYLKLHSFDGAVYPVNPKSRKTVGSLFRSRWFARDRGTGCGR